MTMRRLRELKGVLSRLRDRAHTFVSGLIALLLCAASLSLPATPAMAGPVDWQPVAPTAEGQQWWDSGSLRISRDGNLSVLSRFLPADPDTDPGSEPEQRGRGRMGDLYVMEIDCGQKLYRDTSVNGIPRFGAPWLAAGNEALINAVIEASCEAGAGLLQAG
ncbi:MAG: hypothetical protein QM522_03045 [Chitinophagaceae bacterium]|jgi:hypothetical protein|nr:hypothetical protein [Chitinophagaceae bacterium]